MLTEFGAREGRCPKPTPSGTEETADETSVPHLPRLLTRLSGEDWLGLEAGFCRRLPPLQRPQPVLEGFHVNIEDRGDIQSHKLGEEQAADHGQTQRAAGLCPG